MMNMKSLLFGNESEQQSDIVLAQLSQEMYNSGLLLLLLRNMYRIDFEGKKDAVQIFTNILLHADNFYDFFKYVEVSTFDIASDAFATFKELLTRHKMLAADFLEANFDKVFVQYQRLLHSDNYVTKRQSLKLLGELLLDRHNFSVMTRYISNPDNLKLMMNMLKEKS